MHVVLIAALGAFAPAPDSAGGETSEGTAAEPTDGTEPGTDAEAAPTETETETGAEAEAEPEPEAEAEPEPEAEAEPEAEPEAGPTESEPESEAEDPHDTWAKKFGGYGEIEFPFTAIDGSFASVVGGGAGFIILNRLIVGARGYGLVYLDKSYESVEGEKRELTLNYGGADIGAYVVRHRVVESAAHWLVGGGRGCLNANRDDVVCGQTASLFISHLEMSVYFKVAKILRFGAGIGYRFVVGSELDGPGDRELSGGYGTLKIAIGRF